MKFLKLLFFFFPLFFFSQQGFQMNGKEKVIIPFKQINNLIFIDLKVNNVSLTFLVDSGVSETLLFSLENKDVNFENIEKVKFTGLGTAEFLEGLKSSNNHVVVNKFVQDTDHDIYIILDEKLNFSSHVGIPVNGIIGYHFFKNFLVKVDFERQRMTLYKNLKKANTELKNYESLPMSIEAKKPYIQTEVQMTRNFFPSKMLVDLGNSDAVWLFPNRIPNFNYNRPNIDDFLGRGFNGDIYGKRSRIHSLKIGDFVLDRPIVSMPDIESVKSLNFAKDRIGSVGSDVLRRFTIILDYPQQKFYFKKSANFSLPFKFNMSGLDVKHDGMQWERDLVRVNLPAEKNTERSNKGDVILISQSEFQYKFLLKPIYSIAGVRENSPAFLADIKTGDKIIKINSKKTTEMSLQEINNILSSEEDRTIKMEIQRNNRTLYKEFVLKDPIPYQEN